MSADARSEWDDPLKVVDDPDGDAAAEPAADPARPYVCPVCGKSYTSAGGLRAHTLTKHPGEVIPTRKQKAKGTEQAPRRGRAQTGSGTRQERRRRAIRETIDELTEVTIELRRGTGEDPGNLADVLRRDADRLATSLSWIAERVNPLGRFVDLTMGHGGAITIARGFNGVGLWFLRTWRQALARRQSEQEARGLATYLDEEEQEPEEILIFWRDGEGALVDTTTVRRDLAPGDPPAHDTPLSWSYH